MVLSFLYRVKKEARGLQAMNLIRISMRVKMTAMIRRNMVLMGRMKNKTVVMIQRKLHCLRSVPFVCQPVNDFNMCPS